MSNMALRLRSEKQLRDLGSMVTRAPNMALTAPSQDLAVDDDGRDWGDQDKACRSCADS